MSAIIQDGALLSKKFDASLALDNAARECRLTLVGLLKENLIHQQRNVHFNPAPFCDKQFVPFEVGFGSPGLCSLEPALSLNSVMELCAGGTIQEVSLKVPHTVSRTPLSAATAESFPVLLRGIIAVDDLLRCSDDLYGASLCSTSPYREVRGRLNALNVRAITLCQPRVSEESEYCESVRSQWEGNVAKLREMLQVG